MSTKPRILILGAELFQLPAIRQARAMGCHVITLDNRPESPGHEISDVFINCSTTDPVGVLAAAREERIDAIYSMASDIALEALAFTAFELGLPGVHPNVVDTLCNKAKFRSFQSDHGLPHPRFASGATASELLADLPAELSDLVVKPADSSGSRGVSRVSRSVPNELRRVLDAARAASRSGLVCAEEYVGGKDVSVDGLVLDGHLAFACFTKKYRKGLAPKGHRLPGILTQREERVARDSLQHLFGAVGYVSGAFDADLRVKGERCVVLEVAPRLGGNGMPLVIHAHTGVDLIQASLALALGSPVSVPSQLPERRGVAALLLSSPREGVVASVADAAAIRAAVPGVLSVDLRVRPGDQVSAFLDGGDVLGCVLVTCESEVEHRAKVRAIEAALALRLVGHPEPERVTGMVP